MGRPSPFLSAGDGLCSSRVGECSVCLPCLMDGLFSLFGEVTPAYHFCEAQSGFESLNCRPPSAIVHLRVAFLLACTAGGLCGPRQGVRRSWLQRDSCPRLLPCPDIQARSMNKTSLPRTTSAHPENTA